MILSTRSDYTNRKLHGCTALDRSERLVDLLLPDVAITDEAEPDQVVE